MLRFCHSLVLVSSLCDLTAVAVIPPKQTTFQQQLVAEVNKQAAGASNDATPALLQLLSAPAFTSHLNKCCSSVASLSAEHLLDRLVAEVRSAELTHNFNANSSGSWVRNDFLLNKCACSPQPPPPHTHPAPPPLPHTRQ
jgi:hypothetical protein